jgi:hypothetical protein
MNKNFNSIAETLSFLECKYPHLGTKSKKYSEMLGRTREFVEGNGRNLANPVGREEGSPVGREDGDK